MEILLDLNVFIMMTLGFLEILPDIQTDLDGTFAGPASFFMASVLGSNFEVWGLSQCRDPHVKDKTASRPSYL